jgi:hypothetical protein
MAVVNGVGACIVMGFLLQNEIVEEPYFIAHAPASLFCPSEKRILGGV